jgi:hypothetical protein
MIKLLYELSGNLQFSIVIGLIIYFCFVFDIYNLTRYKKAQLNFVVSAIVGFLAANIAMAVGVSITTAITVGNIIGVIGAVLIYGGIALSVMNKPSANADFTVSSPTYSPTKQTQTDPNLPLPMLYGTAKLAGNRIWQADDAATYVKRIVAFAEGEITDFTDIRLNDIPINEISGITVNKYYGTSTQEVDSIISGANHLARCETVGSLKNVAYLAITVPATNDIQANYNLTTVVKGRKIRVYTDENTYTTEYSENPVWVLLDFLTSYNALGLGLNNDGSKNDTLIKTIFDLDTFIESADFCDELIESALTGTVSTNGTSVTGVGTAFKTELSIGRIISVSGEDKTVTAITDDTHLTVDTSFTTMTGQAATEKQPRFSFNMIFDSQTSVRSLLDEIYRNCRGGLFTRNGQFQFKIDKAETISKVFTEDDIIKGSEIFHTIPSEEHYDILKCVYISPNHEWQKVEAFAEIPEYRDGVPIEHSVNMYSCTSFKQASRLAWYYVNSKTLCPNFGEFKTNYRAYDLEVGDVIQHYSILMGATLVSKVTSVTNDGAGIFTVNWRNYDADLYSDTLGSKQPKVLVSVLKDVYAYPDDVQNFRVSQNQNLLEFKWVSVEDATYEIRQGDTWDSATLIATNIATTSYTINLNQRGIFTYWIKSRNNYNYSINATSDVVNVQYLPNMNEIISEDILANVTGSAKPFVNANGDNLVDSNGNNLVSSNSSIGENIYIYNGKLKLIPTTLWQDLTPEAWADSGTRYYSDGLNRWGTQTRTSGNYVSQIFDIGANLQNIVTFNYDFYKSDDSATATFEWKYSEDNETWSDWTLISTGSYKFRYYQVRITLSNPNSATLYITKFIINIDVPDREENYTSREITNASNGITISYATDVESKIADDFIKEEPHILATPLSNNTYPVVTSSTSSNCTVKLYTNTGTLTTGLLNIRVKGY